MGKARAVDLDRSGQPAISSRNIYIRKVEKK